ncbi:site-specific integrase [uncultured Metabacillus sp.]|uniref:tyrosine-type recombinase/integrase n=1 Tax=uncultured Metabacillus sp. TaxID=2860135 RepID=UPI00262B28C8|nr:site-specific integrase [uncultured Metabacillus sp.]
MLNNKVVPFNENSIYSDIQAFFNELEMNTIKEKKNTKITYERNIRQFFKEMCGKDIEHLTIDDIQFKRNDIINYRKLLFDKYGYRNATINQKIASVKSLYNNLEANEYEINASIFNIKRLKENTQEYEVLSENEAYRFANAIWDTEREKKLIKYLLVMFAIRTSFRLEEILNIKWGDLKVNNGVCEVYGLGKGDKNNVTSITVDFYEKILELKEVNNVESDCVFQISIKAISGMMKRLRNHLNIDPSRKIVFHSFRKTAADWLYEKNNDIKEVSMHLHHSNPNVSLRYLNKKKDLTQTPGVLMEQEIDMSFLDDISVDDFKVYFRNSDMRGKLSIKKFYEELNQNVSK